MSTEALWPQIEATMLDEVLHAPRHPLRTVVAPKRAGVYVFTLDRVPVPCLRHPGILEWPVYVGTSVNLARRLGDHRTNLEQIVNLRCDDFEVAYVEMPGDAALACERLLIRLCEPTFNQVLTGFGQKPPGRSRVEHQAPSSSSLIFPGRPVGTKPPKYTRAEVEAQVRAHLRTTVPPPGTWPRPLGTGRVRR